MNGHSRRRKVAIDEDLRHQSAQRMPDNDGLFGKSFDDFRVAIDGFGKRQLRKVRIVRLPLSQLRRRGVLVRPGRRHGFEAIALKVLLPFVPAQMSDESSGHEHDVFGTDGFHCFFLYVDVGFCKSKDRKMADRKINSGMNRPHITFCP